MEPWDLIWDLHQDRPDVCSWVKHAFGVMLRNRYHGNVPPREYLQALLTILEYCGDFHCQSTVLAMIISNSAVTEFKEWIAPTWFQNMPNTLDSFLGLKMNDSEAAQADFLHKYNTELDLQFLYSVRCCMVRWNDIYQHAENKGVVWLHLNCGTRTVSVTGLQKVPSEVQDRKWFVLKSHELKKVQISTMESSTFGRLQGITISTSKGKLSASPDPAIDDWTMFVNFVNFICKVTVDFVEQKSPESNLDCNGNAATEPSRNNFQQESPFNGIKIDNVMMVQHLVPNVSSSQDAQKTLSNDQGEVPVQMCSDSDINEIEICHHYKRDSTNESLYDSDTADESHDKISIAVDRYTKNNCEKETNAEVDASLIAETHSESYISDESAACTDNNILTLQNGSCLTGQQNHNSDETSPNTALQQESQHCDAANESNDHNASPQLIAETNDGLHASEVANPKAKSKRGLRRKLPTPKPRLVRNFKPRAEAHEETGKSKDDSCFAGTPRRETRAFTQYMKEVLPNDGGFKTPNELPKAIKNKNRTRSFKKRKSDGLNLISDIETSPPNAIASCPPLTEETPNEALPSKFMKFSSGDDSGIVSVEGETPEIVVPPKVPHPQSMPTLITPIATPVRDSYDSSMQPDFSNIHEKLNEELKSNIFKVEPTSIIPPGPPPAIPLHINPQKHSICRDYNLRVPIKPKQYEEDYTDMKSENGEGWEAGVMDSSSDTSYLDNTGSAVLLPIDDVGFPPNPIAPEVSAPAGGMENLQQLSDVCSTIVNINETLN